MKPARPKTVPYRRRRTLRTNYSKRLNLLLSGKPRLIVRLTNTQIIAQVATFSPQGDVIAAAVAGKDLHQFMDIKINGEALKKYASVSAEEYGHELKIVFNSSDLDLNRVDVTVVVLDTSQEPIAVSKTNIFTFLARTSRGFEVAWFTPFVGQVNRIDAEADANVFENSNFLRTYGGQEKFKQLY